MLHLLHTLANRFRNGRGQAAPLQYDRVARSASATLPALLLLPLAGIPALAQTPPLPDPLIPVVLKLDDLNTRGGNVPGRWIRVTDLAREKNIKVSIGIICDSFDYGKPAYFDYIKEWQASGLVEFWFHGWDHKQWQEGETKLMEFKGTSYEHQKEHFVKSQALAREKLGFAFTTFGAPFNATDEVTARVLAEDPDIKVFLYGKPSDAAASGKVILDRVGDVNVEHPLFVPNSARFIAHYTKRAPGRRYFVIQGHPAQWDDARWAEFVKIVDFLVENKIPVLTPTELAASLPRP